MSIRSKSSFGIVVLAPLALLLMVSAGHAAPPSPATVCAKAVNDDTLRPLPPDWAETAGHLFDLPTVKPQIVQQATVWRCVGGKPMACFIGANLPCGKLDTRPELPAVSEWCHDHPGTPVPAFVTGHDTMYIWRCKDEEAERDGLAWHLDARGFASELWQKLPVTKITSQSQKRPVHHTAKRHTPTPPPPAKPSPENPPAAEPSGNINEPTPLDNAPNPSPTASRPAPVPPPKSP